jgi:hypothetical protein
MTTTATSGARLGAVDPDIVREFLMHITQQAERALKHFESPGLLQLSRARPEENKLLVTRYAITDFQRMSDDAVAFSETGFNVYIEGRTVHPNLSTNVRGNLEDTIAVFALVIDSDADKNKAWAGDVQSSMVIETSPGNAHFWFFLACALPPWEAKELGERIRFSARADYDTGIVTQPYRVAGTRNYPNATKCKRGRVLVPTRILDLNSRLWTPDQIKESFPLPDRRTNGNGRSATGEGPAEEGDLPPVLRTLIREGAGPRQRSTQFYRAVAWLRDLGFTADGITRLLERHPTGIGAKYIGRLCSEVERVWGKIEHDEALNGNPADLLAEMNARYSVVLDGGKVRVLSFERDVQRAGRNVHVRKTMSLLSFDDFKNLHLHRTILWQGHRVAQGHWWLAHPDRRQFEGITFQPGGAKVIEDRLNLWQGWGVDPKPGDWSLMVDHIWTVLASEQKETFLYILNWLAWALQHPDERPEVALVFRGKRGTGKGTLGNAMVRIFGQHGVHISNVDHLAGRFNAHLRDTCLLFADEAYWPGDKRAEGTFKRLITEPDLLIEAKGRDPVTARNMLHIIMASNEDWIVPAGEQERRFAVFDVSDRQMQREAWFAPLYAQLEGGGYAAMLYDLQHRNLKEWHPRRIPKTEALLEQQLQSLQPLDVWWVELLETGVLESADPGAPDRAVSNTHEREVHESDGYGRTHTQYFKERGLYDQARSIEPRLKQRSYHLLGHFLRENGCINCWVARNRGWQFPPLGECRAKWESRFPGWKWRDPNLTEWRSEKEIQF